MPFIILAFVVIVGVGIYLGYLWEKKRREALSRIAQVAGLSFSAGDPFNLPGRLGHIGAFSRGHSQRAKNVLHGTYRDREVIAFDFKYTTTQHTNKGTRNTNHHFSACVHPLECPFPQLAICPEGFFAKVADFFGFDDIDFESDEFSRKFRVTSDDRKFAYDVCHVRMMEWLLQNRGWSVELVGGYCVLRAGSRRWKPDRFQEALYFIAKFFEMIPDFVWREYQQEAGA